MLVKYFRWRVYFQVFFKEKNLTELSCISGWIWKYGFFLAFLCQLIAEENSDWGVADYNSLRLDIVSNSTKYIIFLIHYAFTWINTGSDTLDNISLTITSNWSKCIFFASKKTCRCMMTPSNGNIFRVTCPLCGEFTGYRWIPHAEASDAELWCFLWSAPKQTVE